MSIINKIAETLLWKVIDKLFPRITKPIIVWSLIAILIVAPFFIYIKYYQKINNVLYYSKTSQRSAIEGEIDNILGNCHTNGIYIGFLIVKDSIMRFDILKGILNSSPDLKITDTLKLNRFYSLEFPLDSNTAKFIISDYRQNKLSVINYAIAMENNLEYFISLYNSLSVHGAVDSLVEKMYLTPYIVDNNILWIVGISFSDSTKISYCNANDIDANSQRGILLDLKKRIIDIKR